MAAPGTVTGVTLSVLPNSGEEPAGRMLVLLKDQSNVLTIGRKSAAPGPDAQDAADGATFRCPVISRKHARIAFSESGNAYIVDLKSHHGTHILKQGEPTAKTLTPETPTMLADGDLITFGKAVGKEPSIVRPVSVRVQLMHDPSSSNVTNASSTTNSSTRPWARIGLFYPPFASDSSSDDSDIEEIPNPNTGDYHQDVPPFATGWPSFGLPSIQDLLRHPSIAQHGAPYPRASSPPRAQGGSPDGSPSAMRPISTRGLSFATAAPAETSTVTAEVTRFAEQAPVARAEASASEPVGRFVVDIDSDDGNDDSDEDEDDEDLYLPHAVPAASYAPPPAASSDSPTVAQLSPISDDIGLAGPGAHHDDDTVSFATGALAAFIHEAFAPSRASSPASPSSDDMDLPAPAAVADTTLVGDNADDAEDAISAPSLPRSFDCGTCIAREAGPPAPSSPPPPPPTSMPPPPPPPAAHAVNGSLRREALSRHRDEEEYYPTLAPMMSAPAHFADEWMGGWSLPPMFLMGGSADTNAHRAPEPSSAYARAVGSSFVAYEDVQGANVGEQTSSDAHVSKASEPTVVPDEAGEEDMEMSDGGDDANSAAEEDDQSASSEDEGLREIKATIGKIEASIGHLQGQHRRLRLRLMAQTGNAAKRFVTLERRADKLEDETRLGVVAAETATKRHFAELEERANEQQRSLEQMRARLVALEEAREQSEDGLDGAGPDRHVPQLIEREDVRASIQALQDLVRDMELKRAETNAHLVALKDSQAAKMPALPSIMPADVPADVDMQVMAPASPAVEEEDVTSELEVPELCSSLKRKRSELETDEADEGCVLLTQDDTVVQPAVKRARKSRAVVHVIGGAVVGAAATWAALAFS